MTEVHDDPRRTLGSELRGARLGYRWLQDPGVYVRISDTLDDAGFRLDLAPAGQIPSPKRGPSTGDAYRCWWENQGGTDIRPELSALIRRVLSGNLPTPRIRTRIVLDFDDDGTLRTALPR